MTQSDKKSRRRPVSGTTLYILGGVVIAVAAIVLGILVAQLRRPEPAVQNIVETLPPPEANPYGPEDFGYEGEYLTCLTADSALGVDVSEHQGEIDWNRVREAGVEFAIIRLGYRGYTEGGLFADTHAMDNLLAARKAGLQIGAYFYSQAISPEEAREEARYSVDVLQGMHLDLPLVFDWEYVSGDARTGQVSDRTVTEAAIAFCQTVEAAGYDSMIYFNQDLAGRLFLLEELTDYPFWLAMYSEEMTYPYRVKMWQYTAQGNVPGIAEPADLNLLLP